MDKHRQQLGCGLEALGLVASAGQQQQWLDFVDLLAKWNKTYNLTAVRDPLAMVSLHVLDSLAVAAYLRPSHILDIGTGAGLPGIPLAIYCPHLQFTLLDSNGKKTRFVQQAIMQLNLPNVRVLQSRVESFKPEHRFDTVICRAFASMPAIIESSRPLLSEGGCLLAMKGQRPDHELQEITAPCSVIPVSVPGVDGERCLIQIEKMKA